MSKTSKVHSYLTTGAELTPRQISGTFGLKNPADVIYRLRNKGVCIYTNYVTLADGRETVKYRIGTPSTRIVALSKLVAGAALFRKTTRG